MMGASGGGGLCFNTPPSRSLKHPLGALHPGISQIKPEVGFSPRRAQQLSWLVDKGGMERGNAHTASIWKSG